jgi:hypothetical protein
MVFTKKLSHKRLNKTKNKSNKLKNYLKEDDKSRIARDVFIYTKINNKYEFLVKKWNNKQHRAQGLYGNAFGTFLCRPPKDQKDLDVQLSEPVNANTILIPQYNKLLLTYNVKNGIIGFKTNILKKILDKDFKKIKPTKIECYKIPSCKTDKNSMLDASMTILACFIKIDKREFNDLRWLSAKDSYNPKINIHSGIVSHFLKDMNEKTNEKILTSFPKINTTHSNQKILKGNDVTKIYHLINKL